MSLQNELKAILYVIPRLIKEIWESKYNIVRSYGNIIGIVLLIGVAGACSYFGYRWYVVSREQKAQVQLADHLQEYQRAVVSSEKTGSKDELLQLESLFATDYDQHKKSAIAPLFFSFQADAQVKQGKYTQAIDTLQSAINALPEKSPLIVLFKTKRALVQLDNQDDAMQQLGLRELVQLARDKDNHFSDIALFYLGRYYWAHDKIDDAKKAWQELVDTPAYTQQFPSPWAQEAHEKLKLIAE